jgi:profilin
VEAFKAPTNLREKGFRFGGSRYTCVRADKNSIYAKDGNSGVILVRTTTMIILGTYSATMHPSVCVSAIEKLGEYFREKSK